MYGVPIVMVLLFSEIFVSLFGIFESEEGGLIDIYNFLYIFLYKEREVLTRATF